MKRMIVSRGIIWTAILVIFLISNVFLLSSANAGGKKNVLKLGVIASLSGPAAPWGLGGANMAKMWAEEINSAGGLKIGNKIYKIDLIAYDHKCLVAEAATLAQRMIFNDRVKYIVHASIGSCCAAIQTISEPNKVFLSSISWGVGYLGKNHPYTFRHGMTPDVLAPIHWEWITKKYPKIKKVAIITPNDDSGWATRDAVVKACETVGVKVVANEVYDRGTTDFAPIMTKILARNPDALSTACAPPGDIGLILKEAYALGFKGIKEGTACSDAKPVIDIAGDEACEGLVTGLAFDLNSPLVPQAVKDISAAYETKYRDIMPGAARDVGIILAALKAAWEKAGTVDLEKAIAELQKMRNVEAFVGPIAVGGKELYGINRQLYQPIYMSMVKDGKLVAMEVFLPEILK